MRKILVISIMTFLLSFLYTNDVYAKEDTPRMYTITIDRFLNENEENDSITNKDGDKLLPFGGDFEGIDSELDYIKDMGFDTILLSPVFEMDDEDYLGYNVTDYSQVAERYGGDEGFKTLIEHAHEKDLDIVVDLPTTSTDEFVALENPKMNDIMKDYYSYIDGQIIDFNNQDNQKKYKKYITEFVNRYDIDGVSMYLTQNIDRDSVLPSDITAYGIPVTKEVESKHFDYVGNEEIRESIAERFSKVDEPIPEYPENKTILMADHFFSERFTHHAVENNMFPGTRVKQLYNYFLAYDGPIAVQYGTEIAVNASQFPEVHPQMDLWTDKELVDYMKETFDIFNKHKELLNGERQTILNEDGQYMVLFKTTDVDYILNINNSSQTLKREISAPYIDEDKEMSGLLLGEIVKPHGKSFYPVLDREQTELYAIISPAGLNNWYLMASLLIFGGFAIFIWIVARRSKKKSHH